MVFLARLPRWWIRDVSIWDRLGVTRASGAGLRRRMQHGVTWSIVGGVGSQGSSILVGIIVANILGRAVFGEYSMIQSTVSTGATFGALGAGYTAGKYLAQWRSSAPDRAGRILGLGLVVTLASSVLLSLLLATTAPWLAREWFHAPQLSGPLAVAALLIPLTILNLFAAGALAGLEAYSLTGRGAILAGLCNLTFCSLGLLWLGLPGAVGGLVVGASVQLAWLSRALLKEIRAHAIILDVRSAWLERDVLMNFGLPAGLAGFSTLPALWFANSILARQQDGLPQLAIFGAAFSLKSIALYVPILASNVGMTLLNHTLGVGTAREYRRVFWNNFRITSGLAVVGAAVIAVGADPILRLFGRSFSDGVPVLWLMLLAGLPEALSFACYQAVQSQGRMWLSLFGLSIPRDITLCLLAFVLAPRYGAAGLAGAFLSAQLVSLLAHVIALRFIGLEPTIDADASTRRSATSAGTLGASMLIPGTEDVR